MPLTRISRCAISVALGACRCRLGDVTVSRGRARGLERQRHRPRRDQCSRAPLAAAAWCRAMISSTVSAARHRRHTLDESAFASNRSPSRGATRLVWRRVDSTFARMRGSVGSIARGRGSIAAAPSSAHVTGVAPSRQRSRHVNLGHSGPHVGWAPISSARSIGGSATSDRRRRSNGRHRRLGSADAALASGGARQKSGVTPSTIRRQLAVRSAFSPMSRIQ